MLTPPPTPRLLLLSERGFTLIEVIIAMAIGLMVSLAAFSLLEFTSNDVSRITDRAHADQTGRVALENIMLQLHSACVAVTINPIQEKSTENELKFISETSPLNVNKEPVSSLATVGLHKIVYTPPSGKTAGTLTEKVWTSTGTTPNFAFNEAAKPATERLLLKGVSQTLNEEGKSIPVFQYYRYYNSGDAGAKYGQLDPVAISPSSKLEAGYVAKVTANLTLAPETHESSFAKGDRAIALEDSAILRLAPSSEASAVPNEPCTQQ
jgi:prepilin-type N-terminal cleavage/methylation domain-containing protein